MNKLILQVLQLALSLAQAQLTGKPAQNLSLAEVLLAIVRKGAQAYWLQTGQPVDPSVLKVEAEL